MRVLIILLLITSNCFAQESFSVIFVKGNIKLKSSNAAIKRGMKIKDSDELIYSGKSDMIAAISPSKGRVIIQPEKSAPAGSELAFVVKDIYLPMKSSATTRSVAFSNLQSIQRYFQIDYLMLPENSWQFNSNTYPLTDQSFFFIRYQFAGENEPINKKLPSKDGLVVVNREELLKIDEQSISHQQTSVYQLFYLNGDNVVKISDFNPLFPTLEEIKSEMVIIKDSGIDNPFDEVKGYMKEAYGNFDIKSLKAIYDSL